VLVARTLAGVGAGNGAVPHTAPPAASAPSFAAPLFPPPPPQASTPPRPRLAAWDPPAPAGAGALDAGPPLWAPNQGSTAGPELGTVTLRPPRHESTRTPPPPARRARPGIVSLVLALVVAFGAWTGYRALFGDRPPESLRGYMKGEGETYTGAGYSVRFPERPQLLGTTVAAGTVTVPVSGASVFRDDYELAIATGRMPAGLELTPEFVEQNQALFANAFRTGFGASDVSTKRSELAGHEAIDLRMKISGKERVAMRIAQVDNTLFVLLSHTRGGTDAVLDEFAGSLASRAV
jgi:hypothetical protein